MADYEVVNPATGESIREYPTITDDELRDAIGRADRAHAEWAASSAVEDRVALIRRVGEIYSERRDELAEIIVREMGKPMRRRSARSSSSAAIYRYYADNGPTLLADEPIELLAGAGTAVVRKQLVGLLLGIMPWNYPVLPGGAVRRAQPDDRQHDPAQARPAVPRVGAGDGADLRRRRAAPRAPTSTSSPPTSRSADIIADPRVRGRLGDRLRARRRGRRRDRRAQPQEGRARARRLRPVHPARHRRPRRRRRAAVGAPAGQHRPGLQRRQAVHRRRRALRRVRRAVHRGAGAVKPGDPTPRARSLGPLSSGRRHRPAGRAGRARGRPGRDAASPAASARRATSSRPRCSPTSRPTTTPTARSSSGRWPSVYRVARRGRGGRAGQRHPVRARAPTCAPPTRAGAARRRPDRRRHGLHQRRRGSTAPSCRSAASSAPASAASSGRFGIDEFVNKKLIRVAG